MREGLCLLRTFRRCSFRCLLPHLSLRDIFPRWGRTVPQRIVFPALQYSVLSPSSDSRLAGDGGCHLPPLGEGLLAFNQKTTDSGGHLYMTVALIRKKADILGRTSGTESTTSSLLSASKSSLTELFRNSKPEDAYFLGTADLLSAQESRPGRAAFLLDAI